MPANPLDGSCERFDETIRFYAASLRGVSHNRLAELATTQGTCEDAWDIAAALRELSDADLDRLVRDLNKLAHASLTDEVLLPPAQP